MGNSDHGTTYMRVEGDDGELRSWYYINEGRRGRWRTLTMALHIRIQYRKPQTGAGRQMAGGQTMLHYRGTSLIRNRRHLGPYSRTMPRALGWP